MKSKLLFTLTLALFFIPAGVFAAEFKALVGIPGVENIAGDNGLNQYINALYRLSISIAALLAVIKIVIAGAKYMLTDIVPAKEEAKKDIQGALIGLLIVIGAIIILNTINTDLADVNFELENVVLDDAPILDGNDQRDAACPPDECTYYPCSEALLALSGLPAGSSCRQMCDSINGFFYQTQTGARECAATAADLESTGNSQIVRIPCDQRSDGSFSCIGARGECGRAVGNSNGRGGTLQPGGGTSAGEVICLVPTNQNPSQSTQPTDQTSGNETTRSAPGITIDSNRAYLVNDPAIYDNNGTMIEPPGLNHASVINFPENLVVERGVVDVIINGNPTKISCDLIQPPVCT